MVKKRVLLLGGEGFLGRNIAAQLAERHVCVSASKEQSVFPLPGVQFLQADPYSEKITDGFDCVIHLIDNRVPLDAFETLESQLAENVRLHAGTHLIVFSSAVVYANPESEYGRRKLLIEKFYSDYGAKHELKLTILRPQNIFGPYQLPFRPGSLIANLFCNHLNGRVTEINDLQAERDFIYAPDLARAVERVIDKVLTGTSDIGTGKNWTLGEFIAQMEVAVGAPIAIHDRKASEVAYMPKSSGFLIGRISQTPLLEALAATLHFYKEALPLINKVSGTYGKS